MVPPIILPLRDSTMVEETRNKQLLHFDSGLAEYKWEIVSAMRNVVKSDGVWLHYTPFPVFSSLQ